MFVSSNRGRRLLAKSREPEVSDTERIGRIEEQVARLFKKKEKKEKKIEIDL